MRFRDISAIIFILFGKNKVRESSILYLHIGMPGRRVAGYFSNSKVNNGINQIQARHKRPT